MTSAIPVLDEAEIVVVGGGPAGAIAAFTLASNGHDVVLIDRQSFPREKPCGDGLSSSAVSFIHELELDDVLSGAKAIDGARMFSDWRMRDCISMRSRSAGRSWQPCSIVRSQLDLALVEHACSAGARLVHGYVTGPLRIDGGVGGVVLRRADHTMVVHARHVVAADGATSRLRRELIGPAPTKAARAYAVRRYVRSDEALDPSFDIYAGVSDSYAGYGWVFPISEHVANVGIGYMSARGLRRPDSATRQLDAFLEGLQRHRCSAPSALTRLGPAQGAPLGIGFASDRCDSERVLFIGDASRTCDPITGEGIDQAMRSAHAAASILREAIRRKARPTSLGPAIARSNLRLGQDSAMIARHGERLLREGLEESPAVTRASPGPLPLFSAARAMLAPETVYPSLSDTPAGRMASRLGFGEFLDALDTRIRDRLRNEFALSSELLYREACSGLGPVGAVVLAASVSACGGRAGERDLDAALSAELLRTVPRMLACVTQTGDDLAKGHNALAVTTADFALALASSAAAGLGARFSEMLAEAIETTSGAAALSAQDRNDARRSRQRYVEWARVGSGAALSMAARMGACLAGADRGSVDGVGAVGMAIGVATQICDDVLALVQDDPVTGRRPYELLEQGDFRLPTILALEAQPELASLLGSRKERREWEAVAGAIKEGEGLVRAAETCGRYAGSAQALAVTLAGDGNPLAELCDLLRLCLSRLSLSPPATAEEPASTLGDAVDVAS